MNEKTNSMNQQERVKARGFAKAELRELHNVVAPVSKDGSRRIKWIKLIKHIGRILDLIEEILNI